MHEKSRLLQKVQFSKPFLVGSSEKVVKSSLPAQAPACVLIRRFRRDGAGECPSRHSGTQDSRVSKPWRAFGAFSRGSIEMPDMPPLARFAEHRISGYFIQALTVEKPGGKAMPGKWDRRAVWPRPRPAVTPNGHFRRITEKIPLLFVVLNVSLAGFPAAGFCDDSKPRGPAVQAVRPSGPGGAGSDGIPSEAVSVECRVLLVQNFESGDDRRAVKNQAASNERIFSVIDRQVIGSEAEYRKVFKKSSARIDWSKYRILVVQEFTCYKFNQPDSACSLAGVYRYGDTLYVKMNISRYGPAQGILQQMEWFSYEYRNLFLLIPSKPAKIEFCFPAVDPHSIDVP
jgi:hypothetical protein